MAATKTNKAPLKEKPAVLAPVRSWIVFAHSPSKVFNSGCGALTPRVKIVEAYPRACLSRSILILSARLLAASVGAGGLGGAGGCMFGPFPMDAPSYFFRFIVTEKAVPALPRQPRQMIRYVLEELLDVTSGEPDKPAIRVGELVGGVEDKVCVCIPTYRTPHKERPWCRYNVSVIEVQHNVAFQCSGAQLRFIYVGR